MENRLIRHSRFLSMVLRHNPSSIGIELDEAGWVDVSTLLEALRIHGPQISMELLVEIVETNDKKDSHFPKIVSGLELLRDTRSGSI